MTTTYLGKRIGRAVACALALGFVSGAPLAQSLLKETPSTWQFPPTLTLPATATASSPRRAPEPAIKTTIEKMWLDAGALFDFDTDELRPEGRAALDDFVGRLKGATLGMIRAVGHADRLGSEAYNQILSEDRAEAVKAYLVSKGIEPVRVRAEGRGATQPLTKRGECAGGKSAKVIACLQPDRRVGIEVAGTRPSTNFEENQMNWDQIEGTWSQFKGGVKQRWGKLTDDQLNVVAGKRDLLASKIKELYRVTTEETEKQLADWQARVPAPEQAK